MAPDSNCPVQVRIALSARTLRASLRCSAEICVSPCGQLGGRGDLPACRPLQADCALPVGDRALDRGGPEGGPGRGPVAHRGVRGALLAACLAAEAGIALVGFLRGPPVNVCTGGRRVLA